MKLEEKLKLEKKEKIEKEFFEGKGIKIFLIFLAFYLGLFVLISIVWGSINQYNKTGNLKENFTDFLGYKELFYILLTVSSIIYGSFFKIKKQTIEYFEKKLEREIKENQEKTKQTIQKETENLKKELLETKTELLLTQNKLREEQEKNNKLEKES